MLENLYGSVDAVDGDFAGEDLHHVTFDLPGGGTGSGQRLWGPVPGKPGPDGRNISSKKYLFDELTKNSGKKSAIPLL